MHWIVLAREATVWPTLEIVLTEWPAYLLLPSDDEEAVHALRPLGRADERHDDK